MRAFWAIAMVLAMPSVVALAQTERMNFKNRQAVVINNAAGLIELSEFRFENRFAQSRTQLTTELKWKNISSKPITAFEVVILRYDPFNRPIQGGGTWMISGKNSGDWSPLMPGQSSSDGLIGYRTEPILTSVAYVRAIRFEDGAVWTADIPKVEQAIRQKLPVLRDLGDVSPPVVPPKKE